MQKQIQSKRSNRSNTVSLAAEIKTKENDDAAVEDIDIDIDQFSFEYLRSFFREQCEEEMAKIGRNASLQSESPGYVFPQRRGAPVSAADDEALYSSASPAPAGVEVEEDGSSAAEESDVVVIVTYSRSPSEDFRRSMMEIMAARVECEGEVDREFMEDLLLRYLEINNEKFYRHILQAFLELIGVSFEESGKTPPRRRRWSGGFSRRKLKLEIKSMHKFCSKYRC